MPLIINKIKNSFRKTSSFYFFFNLTITIDKVNDVDLFTTTAKKSKRPFYFKVMQ